MLDMKIEIPHCFFESVFGFELFSRVIGAHAFAGERVPPTPRP